MFAVWQQQQGWYLLLPLWTALFTALLVPGTCARDLSVLFSGQLHALPDPSEAPAYKLPDSASKPLEFAQSFTAYMKNKYPEQQLFLASLKHSGGFTKQQLEHVFHKCTTPGSTISIGTIGGSITHGDLAYPHHIGNLMRRLCPASIVQVYNGARASHGSMTLGLCPTEITHTEIDIMITEFALNDYHRYTTSNGTFSSMPYELLIRNVHASYQHTHVPAIIQLFFWAGLFKYDSAQPWFEHIGRHYDITGISLRDLVWPYVDSKRQPYAQKDDVCVDGHHPTAKFHAFTADLVGLYVCEHFLQWVDAVQSSNLNFQDRNDALTSSTSKVQLPEPINRELAKFDLTADYGGFSCSIVPEFTQPDRGHAPVMRDVQGWQHIDRPACIQIIDRSKASGSISVHVQQGYIIMSNCVRGPGQGKQQDTGPAFALNYILYEANGVDIKAHQPIKLVNVLPGVHEAFVNEVPLPPGNHTLQVVAHPHCAIKEDNKCDGFFSLVTL